MSNVKLDRKAGIAKAPNILITGITGFIGQNLYQYLRAHHEMLNQVYALSRDPGKCDRLFDKSVHCIEEIRAQTFDTYKIDVIIHLAGIAHDISGIYKAEDYKKVNYDLTRTLYDTFLNAEYPAKFIFISSVKALADAVDGRLLETFPANPKTAYGKSKRMAEEYIFSTLREHKQVYIIRPSMVYGPGNKGNLNLLYQVIKKGIPYPLGAYSNKRSFLSVNNLSYVISELIRKELPSQDFNCSDNHDLSTNELVYLIARSLDKKAKVWSVPRGFISALASLGSALKLPFNRSVLQKLTENYRVSTDKLLSSLKIDQMPYKTEEELLKTLRSFERV